MVSSDLRSTSTRYLVTWDGSAVRIPSDQPRQESSLRVRQLRSRRRQQIFGFVFFVFFLYFLNSPLWPINRAVWNSVQVLPRPNKTAWPNAGAIFWSVEILSSLHVPFWVNLDSFMWVWIATSVDTHRYRSKRIRLSYCACQTQKIKTLYICKRQSIKEYFSFSIIPFHHFVKCWTPRALETESIFSKFLVDSNYCTSSTKA